MQVAELQRSVFEAKAAKVAEFEADKPRLKGLLGALGRHRQELQREVAELQATVNRGAASQAQPRAGVSTGAALRW